MDQDVKGLEDERDELHLANLETKIEIGATQDLIDDPKTPPIPREEPATNATFPGRFTYPPR